MVIAFGFGPDSIAALLGEANDKSVV